MYMYKCPYIQVLIVHAPWFLILHPRDPFVLSQTLNFPESLSSSDNLKKMREFRFSLFYVSYSCYMMRTSGLRVDLNLFYSLSPDFLCFDFETRQKTKMNKVDTPDRITITTPTT